MVPLTGTVPYVFCADAGAVADWCVATFGFVERGRWFDDDGQVQNVELESGVGEVWLDGQNHDWQERLGMPSWLGFLVDDVVATHADLQARGIVCEPPADREFGVRILTVPDPEGHLWGFVQRRPGDA